MQVVEIPLNRIRVTTRLRGTDPQKVTDIDESVDGVGLTGAPAASDAVSAADAAGKAV